MVTRDTAWPAGTPCWIDLAVDDISRASAFYTGMFGWYVQPGPPEAGGYAMCLKDDRAVAGIGPKQGPPGTPAAWTTYLASDDLDETVSKIKAAGGLTLMEPMDVMDVGRMAVAADPGGAVFGIWQAQAHTGVGLANEPGSLCWNENISRAFDQNQAFYQAVFGYEYGDLSGDGYRYATLKVNGTEVGGIGESDPSTPADVPAHWSTYFGAADTDAAARAASAAGGRVIQPPRDSPYGRIAVVADDQGATFSLISPPPP
jgi:predicted enzyme related to lactoylglutathione lyase